MVEFDIDCAQIPGFINEEIYHVESLQCGDKDKRWLNISLVLVLIRHIRKVAAPCKFAFSYQSDQTYIRVHTIIPALPLLKSLRSKFSPNRGFNSMPMKKSYRKDPVHIKLAFNYTQNSKTGGLTAELPIFWVRRHYVRFDERKCRDNESS